VTLLGLVHAGPSVTMALALASGILVLGGNIGLNAVSGMIYPTFIRSTGTGAAFAAGRIGALIGPVIAGALMAAKVPLEMTLAFSAIPLLAAGVASHLLGRSLTEEAVTKLASSNFMAARGSR
jgi:AAHS family 4-hydroxybenzoate transporter-like MFS transporter